MSQSRSMQTVVAADFGIRATKPSARASPAPQRRAVPPPNDADTAMRPPPGPEPNTKTPPPKKHADNPLLTCSNDQSRAIP